MARLPRLALAGLPHHVIQRGHNLQPVFMDADDRQAYLDALRETSAVLQVLVHGYVLMPDHVHLLVTPPRSEALGQLMQGVGRRYVAGFNRRHGRRGTLWEGRYRATVVDPGAHLMLCLCAIEQNPVRSGLVAQAVDWPWSSAGHHVGRHRDLVITEPQAYWGLGNTPFERELRWKQMLEDPLPEGLVDRIVESATKGWALGSEAFLQKVGAQTLRPVQPRPRGRPRRAPQRCGEGV